MDVKQSAFAMYSKINGQKSGKNTEKKKKNILAKENVNKSASKANLNQSIKKTKKKNKKQKKKIAQISVNDEYLYKKVSADNLKMKNKKPVNGISDVINASKDSKHVPKVGANSLNKNQDFLLSFEIKQNIIKTKKKTSDKNNEAKVPKQVNKVNIKKEAHENIEVTPLKQVDIKGTEKKKIENSDIKIIDHINSIKTGEELFAWLISPVEVDQFFQENWEKQPLIIKRKRSKFYSHLLSCEEIDKALRTKQILFTKNIDITSYSTTNKVRETHNPPGRATAPVVWDYYASGCSIRMLNPQTFFSKIHALNASLQEYFGSFVGANVYLTPSGTQGFAPHFDDIEAFVIQLEGEKLWKLYAPRKSSEVLPRYSSGNFTEEELGSPIQEVVLKAGDIMYFPRGIIHQASALEHTHSLHITLSVYQKNSWADLLEILLPAALKSAAEEDVSFREGLPMHYLSHLGLVNSDKESEVRTEFLNKIQNLMQKLVNYAPVDAAVDQMGKQFMHDALPPYVRRIERMQSVQGDGEFIRNGIVYNQAEMCLSTRIKLIRYHCIRLVREGDAIRIYYSVNNSKEYHGEELQFLEIDEDLAPAIDYLIVSYPDFVTVEDLPIDDNIAKVQVAGDLWDQGILLTDEPLGCTSD